MASDFRSVIYGLLQAGLVSRLSLSAVLGISDNELDLLLSPDGNACCHREAEQLAEDYDRAIRVVHVSRMRVRVGLLGF